MYEDDNDDIMNMRIDCTYFFEGPINVPKETLQISPIKSFEKQWKKLGLTYKQFEGLKEKIRNNLEKAWAPPKGSEGVSVSDCWVTEFSIPKCGNVIRVPWTYLSSINVIFCLMVYSHITMNGVKGQEDLTIDDKILLNKLISNLKKRFPKGGK